MAEGGGTVGRTVRRSRRGEGHAPLPSSTATDPGTGISPTPGSRQRSLHRSSAPARNSNSGACYAAVLSRVPVAVIAARWTTLRRTSRDLKDLAKMGFILVTSLAVIAFAPPLVRLVFSITRAPMETLHQLDAAVDFILPLLHQQVPCLDYAATSFLLQLASPSAQRYPAEHVWCPWQKQGRAVVASYGIAQPGHPTSSAVRSSWESACAPRWGLSLSVARP